jgi:drug/metabolite transporter (DMT)-like permease
LSIPAILLILLSAFIHVSWNLVGKRNASSVAFFGLANLFGALMLLPVLLIYGRAAFQIPSPVWVLLAATGFFEALYYTSLAKAYRHGEMSVAYPLARAFPILFVAGMTGLLGRAERLSALGLVGMLLVFGGCVLLPLENPAKLHWRDYINPAAGLAVLAAAGTAGYSLVDDQALRLLRELPQTQLPAFQAALIYSFWQAVSAVIFMLPVCLLDRSDRLELVQTLRTSLCSAFGMGVGIYAGYILVLTAMAFARDISYVVAFRQTSIPLGTLVGVLLLKERAYPLKFIGSLVIFAGLVLVGVG